MKLYFAVVRFPVTSNVGRLMVHEEFYVMAKNTTEAREKIFKKLDYNYDMSAFKKAAIQYQISSVPDGIRQVARST